MKKFDRALEIDVVKELANEVCVNYFRYLTEKNIDIKEESDDELVKTYWAMVKIEYDDVYKCNDASDFEKMKCQIKKAREELDESKR